MTVRVKLSRGELGGRELTVPLDEPVLMKRLSLS